MRRYHTYIIFALLAVLSGCDRVEVPAEGYIGLGGTAQSASEVTKATGATLVDTDVELQGSSFGIFGFRSADNVNFSTQVFVSDAAEEVSYSGGEWTYEPKQKWIRSNWYRFRAFWPLEARVSPGSDANLMVIDHSTITDLYDLQIAYAERYPLAEGTDRVNMSFRHALSAVRFTIKFPDEVNDSDIITEFYLKGLTPTGTLVCGLDGTNADPDDFRWISNTFDNSSKIMRWTGSKEFGKAGTTIYDNNGAVFMIPQEVSSSKGNTTLNFFTSGGGAALHSAVIPNETWEAGKVYIYTIVIHESDIRLEVDIKDWSMLDSNFDINL